MIFVMYECEERIGYSFKDKTLLRTCFTHSSYSHEHSCKNNERLEFFGDSILGFVVTEYLFTKYPNESEGALTVYKQQIVSRKPLAQAITRLGLNDYILYGEGEKRNTPEHHEAACENLYEALVAGIYLDGGEEEARSFIKRTLLSGFRPDKRAGTEEILQIVQSGKPENYKGKLQEYVQKNKLGEASYKEIEKTGPAHDPVFTVAVYVGGKRLGNANGKKKSEAEQNAAAIALAKLTGATEKPETTGKKQPNAEKQKRGSTEKQKKKTPEKQRGGNKNRRKNQNAARVKLPETAAANAEAKETDAETKTVNKTANNTVGKRKSPASRKGERIK